MSKPTLSEWPFQWYGFWKETFTETGENLPSAYDFVNPERVRNYDPRLVPYLRDAQKVAFNLQPPIPNPFEDEPHPSGSEIYLSDGEWVWTNFVWQYLSEHNLAIPDRFYEHIKGRNFELPPKVEMNPTILNSLVPEEARSTPG